MQKEKTLENQVKSDNTQGQVLAGIAITSAMDLSSLIIKNRWHNDAIPMDDKEIFHIYNKSLEMIIKSIVDVKI